MKTLFFLIAMPLFFSFSLLGQEISKVEANNLQLEIDEYKAHITKIKDRYRDAYQHFNNQLDNDKYYMVIDLNKEPPNMVSGIFKFLNFAGTLAKMAVPVVFAGGESVTAGLSSTLGISNLFSSKMTKAWDSHKSNLRKELAVERAGKGIKAKNWVNSESMLFIATMDDLISDDFIKQIWANFLKASKKEREIILTDFDNFNQLLADSTPNDIFQATLNVYEHYIKSQGGRLLVYINFDRNLDQEWIVAAAEVNDAPEAVNNGLYNLFKDAKKKGKALTPFHLKVVKRIWYTLPKKGGGRVWGTFFHAKTDNYIPYENFGGDYTERIIKKYGRDLDKEYSYQLRFDIIDNVTPKISKDRMNSKYVKVHFEKLILTN